MKRLETLREHLQSGNPAMVREVFQSVIDHIDVHGETVMVGRSKRYKFKKGVITLRKSDVLSSTEAPALLDLSDALPSVIRFTAADMVAA